MKILLIYMYIYIFYIYIYGLFQSVASSQKNPKDKTELIKK